ncbi:MAG: hypothetical protein AAGF33_14120 [Pseudomonadota bacterium]
MRKALQYPQGTIKKEQGNQGAEYDDLGRQTLRPLDCLISGFPVDPCRSLGDARKNERNPKSAKKHNTQRPQNAYKGRDPQSYYNRNYKYAAHSLKPQIKIVVDDYVPSCLSLVQPDDLRILRAKHKMDNNKRGEEFKHAGKVIDAVIFARKNE